MAIGDVNRSSHASFPISKGKARESWAEASWSSRESGKAKGAEETSKGYGPGKTGWFGGVPDDVFDGEVYVIGLQDDTLSYTEEWGSGAYRGETRVLEARARVGGALDLDPFDDGKAEARFGAEAQATVIRTSHGVDYVSPKWTYSGEDVLWAEAHGNGEFLVGAEGRGEAVANLSLSNKLGVRAHVSAFVGAMARAEAEARGYVMGASAGVHASGEAFAGAQAWAEASLGVTGLDASAGAFAGAKAGGTVGADVMGVGLEATGEVWAGAGAQAGVSASWKDGELVIGANAGAGAGLGAAGGVVVTIDTNRLVHEGQELWETATEIVDDAVDDVGQWAQDTAEAAEEWIAETGEAASEWVEDTGEAIWGLFS